jgi:hypothetical protein
VTTTQAEFKSRYKRDPIAELGEPCGHGDSPIDCEPCVKEARASLPALSDFRCREHLAPDMRVVKQHCSHGATVGRAGAALVCEACGFVGHKWSAFICGRRRPTAADVEHERALCPIQGRLIEQERQRVPA